LESVEGFKPFVRLKQSNFVDLNLLFTSELVDVEEDVNQGTLGDALAAVSTNTFQQDDDDDEISSIGYFSVGTLTG
jgi:hypothetical protein